MPCNAMRFSHCTTDACECALQGVRRSHGRRTACFDSCQTRHAVLPVAWRAVQYSTPCEPVACLPDAAAAARRVGLPCTLLARWPASHIAATLRTLPYHTLPLFLASSSSCFGRQTRVCISLVRDCIRGAQRAPVNYHQRQSFCRPRSWALFTWLYQAHRKTALPSAPAAP